MAQGMNLMCVSHEDRSESSRQAVHFYSETHSGYSFSLSLFFHCCLHLSTVSPNTHHHPMMTTARLKTSLRPGNHGNALRRQAGRRPIGFGLRWVGPRYPGPRYFTTRSFWRPRTPNPAATPHYSKPLRVVKWRLASLLLEERDALQMGGAQSNYNSNVNMSSEISHIRLVAVISPVKPLESHSLFWISAVFCSSIVTVFVTEVNKSRVLITGDSWCDQQYLHLSDLMTHDHVNLT